MLINLSSDHFILCSIFKNLSLTWVIKSHTGSTRSKASRHELSKVISVYKRTGVLTLHNRSELLKQDSMHKEHLAKELQTSALTKWSAYCEMLTTGYKTANIPHKETAEKKETFFPLLVWYIWKKPEIFKFHIPNSAKKNLFKIVPVKNALGHWTWAVNSRSVTTTPISIKLYIFNTNEIPTLSYKCYLLRKNLGML